MPKLKTKKILAPKKTFLAIPDHYVNLTGLLAFAELAKLKTTDDAGNNVIEAGTVVNMTADGTVTKPTYVKSSNESGTKGNAIIFNEINVDDYVSGTDDKITATVMVHGFVRADRLTGYDAGAFTNQNIYVLSK